MRYLVDHGYVDGSTITDAHRSRLAALNFHYFLGYAGNYRALADRGRIGLPAKDAADLFRLIDLDARLAGMVHDRLRAVEWRLRAMVVDLYCGKYGPTGFLDEGRYLRVSQDEPARAMVATILRDIYRHDEPYVGRALDAAWADRAGKRPRKYRPGDHDLLLELAGELPLWAVIDAFSLGTLGRFIMTCDADAGAPLWRDLAGQLGVNARIFPTQIKAVTYLRNTVAHHSRLWMRTTRDGAKKPKRFAKRLRDVDSKSMYWAILALATFLPAAEGRRFVAELDDFLDGEDLYRRGITRSR